VDARPESVNRFSRVQQRRSLPFRLAMATVRAQDLRMRGKPQDFPADRKEQALSPYHVAGV